MTRTARRIALIASLVIAATGTALARHVAVTSAELGLDETERYAAYDGGPVPNRPLLEPSEPVLIIGLPREYGNPFAIDTQG